MKKLLLITCITLGLSACTTNPTDMSTDTLANSPASQAGLIPTREDCPGEEVYAYGLITEQLFFGCLHEVTKLPYCDGEIMVFDPFHIQVRFTGEIDYETGSPEIIAVECSSLDTGRK